MNESGSLIDINTMYGINSSSELVRDEGVIVNQIVNVVLIPKRTSKFRPRRGSSLKTFLGKPLSPITARAIRDILHKELTEQVPLAKINIGDIQVNLNNTFRGYSLRITYSSRLSNSVNTIDLDIPAGTE